MFVKILDTFRIFLRFGDTKLVDLVNLWSY